MILITITTKQFGWAASALACDHWDLGSNPRSPKHLFDFVLQVFMCNAPSVVHQMPPDLKWQVACKSNPRAKIEWPSCTLVKRTMGNLKKSTRLIEYGPQNCNSYSLFKPSTPWVCFFILFSFHYFYFIIIITIIN